MSTLAESCDFCVARFLPDGSLDGTFNANGEAPGSPGIVLVPSEPGGMCCLAYTIVARLRGRARVGGGHSGVQPPEDFIVHALRESGAFDADFGDAATPGLRVVDLSSVNAAGHAVFAMTAVADDKVVVAGPCTPLPQGLTTCLSRLIDDAVFADSFE